MIDKEPTNTDLEADARLVGEYLERGLSPDEGEQLAMLFRDSRYRAEVFRRAREARARRETGTINDRANLA